MDNQHQEMSIKEIKIVQINIMHKKNASDVLMNHLSENDIHIALIQEPYFNTKSKSIPSIPSGYLAYYNMCNDVPLAAVIVKESVPHVQVTKFSTSNLVAIQINAKNEAITFASLYCPRNSNPIPESFLHFLDHFHLKQPNLVLGADTNAHSAALGYAFSDPRGTVWDELIAEKSWIIHNSSSNPPTFRNSRGHESVIDWTVTNAQLIDSIIDWRTESYTALSDHLPIEFKLQLDIKLEKRMVRNFKRVSWKALNESLASELGDLTTCCPSTKNQIDELVEAMEKKIVKVMNQHAPLVPLIQRKNKWWNSKLDNLKKEIKRRKRRREKITELIERYDQEISKAKKLAWQKFIGDTSDSNHAMIRYRIMCKNKGTKKLNPVKRLENSNDLNPTYTQSEKETAKLLLSVQNPDLAEDSLQFHTDIRERVDTFLQQSRSADVQPFLDSEVNQMFRNMKTKKSAGPDNIPPILLANCEATLKPVLHNVFNASLRLQYFPNRYKTGRVIFIQKPGGAITDPKSYRPITLLSVIGKLLERIVSNRLWYIAEKEQWLSPEQFGFRRNRGAELALLNFVNQIETNFKRKQETLCLMLDISSAFPSVSHTMVLHRLLQLNCPECYIRWIASYLTQRKVYVDTQDGPVYMNTPHGTPQGAVISSLLFLIVIDDLIRNLNHHDQKTTAFADDLGILVTGSNRKVIEEKMNVILEEIRKWGIETKTKFNTKKTKAMLFSHLRRVRPIRLSLGSEQIELVSQYKYLGITLDSNLSFQAHITNITKAATETISKIMAISKLKWGLNPNSAKQIISNGYTTNASIRFTNMGQSSQEESRRPTVTPNTTTSRHLYHGSPKNVIHGRTTRSCRS